MEGFAIEDLWVGGVGMVRGSFFLFFFSLYVPTRAAVFLFRTLMHSATAAPELSMTFSMDWRMKVLARPVLFGRKCLGV